MSAHSQVQIYSIIPTERYLKKFLNNKVKVEPDYTLSNKDKFGSFLYVCLNNYSYKVELNEKRFNDKIKINIPISYEKLGRQHLTAESIHLINNFLKNWFYEDFIAFMKIIDMFSLRMDKSIKAFCDIYGIDLDIDIQYETLKKKYYRYRQANGEPMHKYLVSIVEEKD